MIIQNPPQNLLQELAEFRFKRNDQFDVMNDFAGIIQRSSKTASKCFRQFLLHAI